MANTKNKSTGGDDAARDTGSGRSGRTPDLPRDDDGGLIDPPVIPAFEQRLRAAHDAADQDEIQSITDEYTQAREDRARVLAEREADR